MLLKQARCVFFIGIKGVAMANLAVIFQKMGKYVTGADLFDEFITDNQLKTHEINYFTDFNPDNLSKEIDLIIYSAAHQGTNNPIAVEGKKRGIAVVSQAEIVGQLTKKFIKVIAVCGCHGKTTTTSMLVYALKQLGQKPSYLVGTPEFNGLPGGDFDGKDFFVIEADEYGVNPPLDKTPKFNFINPDYSICTNIDFDHPDIYKDLNETKKAFFIFLNKCKKLFLCSDDKSLMDVAKDISRKKYLTFGHNSGADFLIKDDFLMSIPGEKNRSNAAGVILCLLNLGFSLPRIKEVIKGFTGAKRRFEKVFSDKNMTLIDDYAHHPNEIKATIQAGRDKFPGQRLIVIFQPHTYSRTLSLLDQFAESLSLADLSLVLPIFASARENVSDYNVSSADIEKKAKQKGNDNVVFVKNKTILLDNLNEVLKKGDVIITMGAGDVYKIAEDIIKIMSNVKAQMSNQIQSSNLQKMKTKLGEDRVFEDKDLTNLLTLHTKTVAEYYYEARSKEDWQKAIKLTCDLKIPTFILGGGSNIAMTTNKINGLVIKNNYIKKEILKENDKEVEVMVSSGYPTGLFVNQMIEAGFEGMEYFKGLPGTVGGAVYMNSKWTRPLTYFGDHIIKAVLLQKDGKLRTYDFSVLHQTKEILIEVIFKFKKIDSKILKERANQATLYRTKSQPKGVSSCGCFFRNISEEDKTRLKLPTNSVGYLIDKLGLKGKVVGSFAISDHHANFIINRDNQKSDLNDLKKLLFLIKNKVKEKYGIELKEEVIII